jgi:hypothetical protein
VPDYNAIVEVVPLGPEAAPVLTPAVEGAVV